MVFFSEAKKSNETENVSSVTEMQKPSGGMCKQK